MPVTNLRCTFNEWLSYFVYFCGCMFQCIIPIICGNYLRNYIFTSEENKFVISLSDHVSSEIVFLCNLKKKCICCISSIRLKSRINQAIKVCTATTLNEENNFNYPTNNNFSIIFQSEGQMKEICICRIFYTILKRVIV